MTIQSQPSTTEELLMMFIKCGYSQSGKVNKSTALAMMRFVDSDAELQRKINIGDWNAVLKHRQAPEKVTISKEFYDKANEAIGLLNEHKVALLAISEFINEELTPEQLARLDKKAAQYLECD